MIRSLRQHGSRAASRLHLAVSWTEGHEQVAGEFKVLEVPCASLEDNMTCRIVAFQDMGDYTHQASFLSTGCFRKVSCRSVQ